MLKLNDVASRILRDDRRLLRFSPLLLASFMYRGAVNLRNHFYDAGIFHARRMKCRVISVGNIIVGGTGKTPVVIMLASMLNEHGYRPAILSRGYGGKREGRAGVVSDGHDILMGTDEAGDEPVLIADSLKDVPVIIGKERSLAGKLAVERFGTDVLILDDAFQHRRLSRDIDIVLLDSEKPFGNGFMLPRGGLREPGKSLQRADAIIFTSTEGSADPAANNMPAVEIPQVPTFRGYRKARKLVGGEAKDILPLEYLKGKRICAFSGIAKPDSFRKILEPLCGEITVFIPFPDHHVYTENDIEHILNACSQSRAEIILTTEKDGIKLVEFPDFFRDIYRLKMEMEIIPSSLNFEEYILTRLET
ncbi:MAG: tetraacyldisaccharide 4'-kinase [Thermodesulfobacteriota bacterium]|nr:tetraacyldisaccharide 4'-kinase [Thermodesulfobacteriota bacterium]